MNFIKIDNITLEIEGSKIQAIELLEADLGVKIPLSLKEYLLLMGEKTIYDEYDYHGTKDMKYIHDWIYEWIDRYKREGIKLSEIDKILPFDKFQDTFFYVPIEEGNENPPVYAFDINDTPVIRKLNDSFTDFVLERYNKIVKSPDSPSIK
ncbi:SMI1/KNR4 family protein [Flavobacterium davisii]|uniref:SMI1/KNR4 family protein n=1 Tax=Flavobacterium columnare TaxID=996 RepID=A0A8G0KX98_9FLAO|nr:SMI1/KNR4 family protein [Flavobacterium davisii]QYS89464.1 SMI1/KNR4 family protein [Flavobacterium davisii]